MMDPALIAELHAGGVLITEGDDLAVIRARLGARIETVATTEPEAFDRPLLDRLLRLRIALDPEPHPEPEDVFTADELMEVIRSACTHIDPDNAEAYRQMGPEHVREAVRISTRLLIAHREYQRVHRITRRGRRKHAEAIYRLLDVVPIPYTVVAEAWALLPTAILDPPEPDPSCRSPLRTENGHNGHHDQTDDTAADPFVE